MSILLNTYGRFWTDVLVSGGYRLEKSTMYNQNILLCDVVLSYLQLYAVRSSLKGTVNIANIVFIMMEQVANTNKSRF